MDYSTREVAESYLDTSFTDELTGAELARILDIPERSARRYLSEYREKKAAPISRVAVPQQNMDAIVFDIETTDFGTEGYSGYLICCSFLPLSTGIVETFTIEWGKGGDDRELLEQVAKKLSQYSFHIGHNIAAYDYNWLNSRLRFHRMPTLNTAYYFDTYQVAKGMALKTSKGLGNLIDYFGLEGTKTTIYRTSWSRISSPYRHDFDEALDEIQSHCELDVAANRRLFDVLHYYSLTGHACQWKLTKVPGNYWSCH